MSHIFVEHVIKATLSKKEEAGEGEEEGIAAARLMAEKFMLLDLQPTRSARATQLGRDAQNGERYKKHRRRACAARRS